MPSTAPERVQRAELAKAARRDDILAAARRVFASRGFGGTTIADIAEEAGIALGTIYLYFPSKEAVFGALSQRLGELIAEAVRREPPSGAVPDTVRRRVSAIFDTCSRNRDLVRLFVLNVDPGTELQRRMRAADDERNRPMAREIARSVQAGVIRPCDPVITARLVQGVITMSLYNAFVLGTGAEADAYRDGCVDMITAYLQPDGRSSKEG